MVMISFTVFVMMSQRIRDIGLMKAAGCPNDLVFGYFMNELLIIVLSGCVIGMAFGLVADWLSVIIFNNLSLPISQGPINFWLVLLVFVAFFASALVLGTKPVLDTTRIEPAKAISPSYYAGLSKEAGFRVISRVGLAIRMGWRSLSRRKSATIRLVLCLSTVLILVTVSVAGGLIAEQTTESWVERAIGKDMLLVAHHDMTDQYEHLLSKFHGAEQETSFNYSDERYAIPNSLLDQLESFGADINVDTRLILNGSVKEVSGIVLGETTGETHYVGYNRTGTSLIIGVDPQKALNDWYIRGRFLNSEQGLQAVVGDTIAARMFDEPLNQSIKLLGRSAELEIVGVCLDPIDNGFVTYVPLNVLMSMTNLSRPNAVMIKVNASANYAAVVNQLGTIVDSSSPDFEVLELNTELEKSINFLGYTWSVVMFVPLFSLVSVSSCLVGYVTLSISEQRQELGILRALGVKRKSVLGIISMQTLLILLSSCAVGISFGTIITLIILVPDPIVTSFTVLEIASWLLAGVTAMFLLSSYPAARFSGKPLLEALSQQ
jgi:putative ABC transport system permease protein